jgi:hypothetical protein
MKYFRWLRNLGLLVLAAVGTGYLSTWTTVRACERHAAYDVIRSVGLGQIYVVAGPDAEESTRILNSVGFQVVPCVPPNGFPEGVNLCGRAAYVHPAHFSVPFVGSVEWGTSNARGGCYGTTVRFLCVFGRAIRLSEGPYIVC